MIAVPGRVLTAPRVMYSGNSTNRIACGSWNMKDKTVWKPATLADWTMLRIGAAADIDPTVFEQQCKALTAGLRSCGMKVNAPLVFPGPAVPAFNTIENGRTTLDKDTVDLKLRETFEKCRARKISVLLVVLPSTAPWVRERVKFWGDKVYGMPSSLALFSGQVHADFRVQAFTVAVSKWTNSGNKIRATLPMSH